MAKIKTPGKIVIFALTIGCVLGAYHQWGPDLLAKLGGKVALSQVPKAANLPTVTTTLGQGTQIDLNQMSSQPADSGKPEVRMNVWAWNAQMGLMLANGGPSTTEGSLMAKNGVNLKLIRQDDSSKMQENMIAFATELRNGNPNPTKGVAFADVMGDGSATFLKALNDNLIKLGPDYVAKVIGSAGYSRGEDKLMGPASWRSNPMACKGGLVSGVLRDGDWNIAQKWLGDNGIKSNPDERTWDPDALNWVNANDYIDAAEKYVAGYSEDRPVVKNGKLTGEKKHVVVQGCVTWTPGDVNVAKKKGGIVPIVSTKEYASQMPHVIIGINKWMKDNRKTVDGMLDAIFTGGDAVKSNDGALQKGAEVSNAVYQEQGTDPGYWMRYYKGVTEPDAQGVNVDLGGSAANNLADNIILFGLTPGAENLFNATYRVFGDIVVAQYPSLVPSYYAPDQIQDTSYIRDLMHQTNASMQSAAVAQSTTKYDSSNSATARTVSRKAWNIQFNTGRANFTPAAEGTLNHLMRDLLVASGTTLEIHGHTDNQGSAAGNQALSEARAFAVKAWLQHHASINFPDSRFHIYAHGDTNPVASNGTGEGRAQNRRVEIVLKATN
jgi:outer membrane protein OmpA-like peptidoglycan-associated protein